MLLIPLPILIKARLPFKRKVILCGVFSLGILVILAAILNRYYNFTSGYGSLVYLNWYAGEASTAVMVANIPHCWPLFSRAFGLGSFKSAGPSGGHADSGSQSAQRHLSRFSTRVGTTHSRLRSTNYATHTEQGDADSIERIVGKGVEPGKRDLASGHEHEHEHPTANGGDMADLELGDLPTPAPRYEARATAGNAQTFWRPGDADGGLPDGPLPSAEGGAGGIVKTVHLDQRYEGE